MEVEGSRERERQRESAVFCAISSPGSTSQLAGRVVPVLYYVQEIFFPGNAVPDITKGLMNFAPRTES